MKPDDVLVMDCEEIDQVGGGLLWLVPFVAAGYLVGSDMAKRDNERERIRREANKK